MAMLLAVLKCLLFLLLLLCCRCYSALSAFVSRIFESAERCFVRLSRGMYADATNSMSVE